MQRMQSKHAMALASMAAELLSNGQRVLHTTDQGRPDASNAARRVTGPETARRPVPRALIATADIARDLAAQDTAAAHRAGRTPAAAVVAAVPHTAVAMIVVAWLTAMVAQIVAAITATGAGHHAVHMTLMAAVVDTEDVEAAEVQDASRTTMLRATVPNHLTLV